MELKKRAGPTIREKDILARKFMVLSTRLSISLDRCSIKGSLPSGEGGGGGEHLKKSNSIMNISDATHY
jgi:hypothetical protein